MTLPLVSIIIPVYNAEPFLAEALASVSQQTYAHWEVLIVDDGSTDGSTAIAKAFAAADPARVSYLTHSPFTNRGLPASRNRALREAKGELTALLDADDVWEPQRLGQHVAIMQQHPECALAGSASLYWSSWSIEARERDRVVRVGGANDRLVAPHALMFDLYPLGTGSPPCPCSLTFRTDIARRLGGFEEEFSGSYQLYEDQAFLAKMFLAEHVFMSSRCLDRYRQRAGSIVDAVHRSGEYTRVRRFFLEWLTRYTASAGIQDKSLTQRIQAALFRLDHPVRSRARSLVRRLFGSRSM